jgi:hypothetical protein
MANDVHAWHYRLCDALALDDIQGARALIDEVQSAGHEFAQDHPVDRALRLLVASRTGERGWLEEAEASLARNADLALGSDIQVDARVAAYFLAGLMRLAEPARAAQHFEAALQLRPQLLAARVELECIRQSRNRDQLFGALGEAIPRSEWRYILAASELGLDLGVPSVTASVAICLRGLCTPRTPALLRLYRALNPGVPIVMATWKETPTELLEPCLGLASVVVMDEPANPGGQNKNRQIMLARAAVAIARPHAERILLARTDVSLFAPGVVSSLVRLHDTFPAATDRMDGRLVIPDIFTRRHRPYHVSDIMCFGAAQEVLRLWLAPFEETDSGSTETYLGWHLWRSLHPDDPRGDHRARYRELVRDYFVIRDFDWFDGFWLRHPHLRNGAKLNFGDACISQQEWERAYFGPEGGLDRFGAGYPVMHAALTAP